MTEVLSFFKKYYDEDITEDELKDITDLILTRKQIHHLPSKVFHQCINLRVLDLSFNELFHLDSDLFENCVNLWCLNLSNNNLLKLQSNLFKNCVKLHTLRLHANYLENIPSNLFENCVNLTTLRLNFNKITNLDSKLLYLKDFVYDKKVTFKQTGTQIISSIQTTVTPTVKINNDDPSKFLVTIDYEGQSITVEFPISMK